MRVASAISDNAKQGFIKVDIKAGLTSIGDAMHDKWRMNLDDVLRWQIRDANRISNDIAIANQQRESHRHRAEEATIELNAQTKEQNRLLRELIDKVGFDKAKQIIRSNVRYQHDVFLSHANDNKEAIVNALDVGLRKLGINVWYDADEIDWGDSLKSQIANGLAKCRFGIVVISPEFLGRQWTERELSELLHRQNESGQKVVLPLLYNLTIEEMKQQYPALSDVKARAIKPDDDAKDIVIDFARILIRALKAERA